MAARAMWKGVLDLDEGIPVKLYSAVEDRKVHFRLLHEKDHVPLRREMINPVTGEAVAYQEAKRGWETEDGRLVVLAEDELESLEPEPSRTIEVLRFVEPGTLSHLWYDRPYYLGPDGHDEAWSALAEALRRTGREGVVRWVMRKKPYVGALRLHGNVPMLLTLRHAGQVVEASNLDAPSGRELEEREMDMARKLLQMLEGTFDPEEWEDTYQARVRELVEAKATGRTISLREYKKRRDEGESLEKALEASLQQAGGRRSA